MPYFESAISLSAQAVVDIIFEDDCGTYALREDEIPTFKINCLLLILKTINVIFRADL